MPSLDSVPDRFESTFTTEGGNKFRGVLDPPLGREPPAFSFTRSRRLLQLRPGAPVNAREVFFAPGGQRFLLGGSTAGLYCGKHLYNICNIFELDQQLTWTRPIVVTDTVTGLPKSTTTTNLGQIWCVLEPLIEDIDRQLHIRQERYRLITGELLQHDDMVGTYAVRRVTEQLGITVAEVQ